MLTKQFVILTYDVGVKRNSRVLKICRKYLIHVQKSVFEGYISDKQLSSLMNTLKNSIDIECDQIAIYKWNYAKSFEKEVIGYHLTNDNII